ncbi:MAG: OmpA family protein [Cyanobacteria bacterium P01_F01_bin.86]
MAELPPFENSPSRPEAVPIGDTLSFRVEPTEPRQTDRWRGTRILFAWLFRCALLGVGVGGAWFLGMLVAEFLPSSATAPPLQEVVVRRTNRVVQKVRRLPAWWRGDALRPSIAPAVPRPATETSPPAPAVRPITLSALEREQVAVELEAIQADLQQLRDRASAVETQLGLPDLDRSLAERLKSAENRLSPPTEGSQAPVAPTTASPPTTPETPPDPLFQVEAYRVTLPSDILFDPGESILQPNSQSLLDSILQDVGQYPGATILVGCYSDIQVGNSTATDLSYQQAIAIQRYLAQRLGNDTYHWVAVGYGNTSLGTVGSTQLGRRVTIAIVP